MIMNAELRYHIYKKYVNTGMSLPRHVTVKSHVGLAVDARQQLAMKPIHLYNIEEETCKLECSSGMMFPKSLKSSSQPSSGAAARVWFMN